MQGSAEPGRSWWSRKRQAWKQISLNNKLILLLTFTIVVCNALYIFYARRQWQVMSGQLTEMSKQTDLLTQQTKGIQAAVVGMDILIESSAGVTYQLGNSGHVIANDVTAHIVVTRESLPGQRQIGRQIIKEIGSQPLIPAGPDGNVLQGIIPIPGFGQKDFAAIHNIEQTITVKYEWGYENGFGDHIRMPTECRSYLSYNFFVSRDGVVTPQSNGFVPCDQFTDKMRAAVESERQAEEQAKTQKPVPKPN